MALSFHKSTSVCKLSFNPKGFNYTGKAVKPNDNVVTGFDKGTYVTEQRASYKERNLAEARNATDIAAKRKQDHFQIGGTSGDIKLRVYKDEYRRDQ